MDVSVIKEDIPSPVQFNLGPIVEVDGGGKELSEGFRDKS